MVTLPESGDEATRVRCPLCSAEYPLGEAWELAPPALIVLPAGEGGDMPTTASKPASGLSAETFFNQGPTITPPADGSGVEDADNTPNGKSATDFSLDFEEHLAEVESGVGEPLENGTDEANRDGPLAASGQTIRRPSADRVKALPPISDLLKPPVRRPVRKKHPIRTFFGVIFGAAFGLLIAYYAVWWIRGEEAGFPRFSWLPFLPAEDYPGKSRPKTNLPAADPTTANKINSSAESDGGELPADLSKDIDSLLAPEKDEKPKSEPSTSLKKDKEISITPAVGTANEAEPQIGPRKRPNFSAKDLDDALQDVTAALFGKNGSGKVNEQSYPQFCRLAEVQTLIAPDKELPSQRQSILALLAGIARDPKQIAEIERLAGEFLANKNEVQTGILLAGKAGKILEGKNGLFGINLYLENGKESQVLMTDKQPDFKSGDKLLLLGVAIPDPNKNLAGYPGSKPMVIWLGASVPVPETPK
jgi:hypothetical protein